MKTPTFFALVFALVLAAAHGGEKPEYLQAFDPAKGFKPAQRDLTEIFLQIAGSLEAYGSPEPYMRHMATEHSRIEQAYRQTAGKSPLSFRPDYMTDSYIDRLAANWKLLSPKVGLVAYAKQFGREMREGIKGTRGTGTTIVDIFNTHQEGVFNRLAGKGSQDANFESLRAELVKQLEINATRIEDGDYEVGRRDAVRSAAIIRAITTELFSKLEKGLKPPDAERVEAVLKSVILDVGVIAQSELEAGIAEWAILKPSTAAR